MLLLMSVPSVAAAAPAAPAVAAHYDVTTYGYDLARTGKNTAETVLTTTNATTLRQKWITGIPDGTRSLATPQSGAPALTPGKLFPETPVTPEHSSGASSRVAVAATAPIDATPVGASDVSTPSGVHNLLYVGNERGGFGAIDADTGALIWSTNVHYQHTTCGDFINGDAGVTGAATIDRTTNRVYVAGGDGKLYAFDLGTGALIAGWPQVITSAPALKHVYGALTLDPVSHEIYAELASYCDVGHYQGSLVAINTDTHAKNVFVVVKNRQDGGGLWGVGGASLDSAGNVFVASGNALPNGATEATPYAEDVIKLSGTNMSVLGANHPPMHGRDVDFGATTTLFNVNGCATPRLAVENKDGDLFIYERDQINSGPRETIHITTGIFFVGLPAFDSATNTLYISNPTSGAVPHGMVARRFGTDCKSHPLWNSVTGPASSPVSSPTLANGVVYYGDGTGKTLHAFNAATGHELWHSAPGDFGGAIFSAPTVFNGQVYAPSRGGSLHAFGF
jgi:outer membrane protein assembly factor BamB